jgi:hypothetical protein
MRTVNLLALLATLLSGCATFEPVAVSVPARASDQYAAYKPANPDPTPGAGGLGGAGGGAAVTR